MENNFLKIKNNFIENTSKQPRTLKGKEALQEQNTNNFIRLVSKLCLAYLKIPYKLICNLLIWSMSSFFNILKMFNALTYYNL